mmetsp:Transcript_15208/g.32881  ORF Transcript_15208/g.32881 Transcript_15208/m.32881 type:complete len:265 (+) Transcript_15208:828-1622(+)
MCHFLQVLQSHFLLLVVLSCTSSRLLLQNAIRHVLITFHYQLQLLIFGIPQNIDQLKLLCIDSRARLERSQLLQLLIRKRYGIIVSIEQSHELGIVATPTTATTLLLFPFHLQILHLKQCHSQLLRLHYDVVLTKDNLRHARTTGCLSLKSLSFKRIEFGLEWIVGAIRDRGRRLEEGHLFGGCRALLLQFVLTVSEQRCNHVGCTSCEEVKEFQLLYCVAIIRVGVFTAGVICQCMTEVESCLILGACRLPLIRLQSQIPPHP